MSECQHLEFEVNAQINRLEDTGKFQADITIRCIQCKTPFRFIGLPRGLDLNGAAVSFDGLEARLAILPDKMPINIKPGEVSGYTINEFKTE